MKRPPPNPVWRQGPPPAIGWWPASWRSDPEMLRWWDGQCWSFAARPYTGSRKASLMAAFNAPYQHHIKWTDPWW